MGRGLSIERALCDAVELHALAETSDARSLRSRLGGIADRRIEDIGPSVPKTRVAELLGVSVTALDNWIGRGAIPVVQHSSGRQEVETRAAIGLAVEVRALRDRGQKRGLLATALAGRTTPLGFHGNAMGTRGFFPDQREERRREFTLLTPGERVAQAIKLSRTATKIAAAAASAGAKGDSA
jgi:hypothetical protein